MPETPRRLVVGLVGLGYWGPNLARNLFANRRITLRWLCDLESRRLDEQAALYPGVRTTRRFDELLRDPEVEAVVVAVPAGDHFRLARRALESGRHVLVEKPLALTSGEAIHLLRRAAERRLKLMVGHTFLYNSAVRHIKDLLDAGDLGEVHYAHTLRVNLGRLQTDVNAFWSIAPHDVSILNHWFGAAPEAVQASGASFLTPGVEDVVFATLFYPQGRMAHIHASWLDPAKERKITLVGSRKMLVYDDMDPEGRVRIYEQGAARGLPDRFFGDYRTRLRTGDIHIPKLDYPEPLAVEIDHFADCILKDRQPLSDGLNGVEVVLVCEAVSESLRHGGVRVKLPRRERILEKW